MLNNMALQSFLRRYQTGDRSMGSRFATMRLALSLIDIDSSTNFVETGTTRKNLLNSDSVEERAADGCATLLFADFCRCYGGHVWTCDINPGNIESCKIASEQYKFLITYVVDDSLNFLKNFDRKIGFLYLDSLDSQCPNANEHQLQEIQNSIDKLTTKSIVLLDDLGTKTNLSIPFLKANNWCQISIDVPKPSHYNNFAQGLFVHEESLWTNHSLIPLRERYQQ